MAAIFIDCLSYGLITPMIVAVFSADVFLAGQPDWMMDVARGLAFALFPLGMFVGAATLGDLSDHWGRKKTLVLCMGGLALAFAAMALSVALGSAVLLLFSRLVSGLLGGSMAIGQAAIIDLSTEETKAVNLGRITIANAMGHFMGPAIGAVLADQHLYLPFAVISIMAVLAMIWIALGLQETRSTTEKVVINWGRPVEIFLEAFRNQQIRQLSFGYLLFHTGNSMTYQFLYIYLSEHLGYSPGELSLFSTLAIGSGALLTTFWWLAMFQKRFNAKTLSVVPLIASGLMTLLLPVVANQIALWVLGFLWAVTIIIAYVSTLKLYSDCVSEDMQGWAMGVAGSVFAFSFIVGGLTSMLLYWIPVTVMLMLSGIILLSSGIWIKELS